MLVTAIAELTFGHQCGELRKICVDFFRFGIPQSQRFPSGGIGQIAAAFEREQLAYNGRVFSLVLAAWLISFTASPSPGWMALSKLDLPAPLGPAMALILPVSRVLSSSRPSPVLVEV